jgi:hypothetical protein
MQANLSRLSGLFWDPVANIIPAKRYFEGLTAKYFSRENICVCSRLTDFKIRFLPLSVSAQLSAERQTLGPLVLWGLLHISCPLTLAEIVLSFYVIRLTIDDLVIVYEEHML